MRIARLRRAEAAACTAFTGPKFKIQYSKLKEASGHAWAYIPVRDAACGGHARCGPAGRELRASAAGGCGPPTSDEVDFIIRQACSRADGLATDRSSPPPGAAAPWRAQIQNSRFKIQNFIQGYSLRASEEGKWLAMSKNGEFRDAACGGLKSRAARKLVRLLGSGHLQWFNRVVIGGAFRKLRPDDYKAGKN